MKEYPAVITPAILAKNEQVSDTQIADDIRDTEKEIEQLLETERGDRLIAENHPSDMERTLARFRAGARPTQIEEMQRFVDFLRRLQTARIEAEVPTETMTTGRASGDQP